MIGTTIDQRYKINSLIAEGGMAHVYKAYDMKNDRVVALKILKSQFSGDKDFIDRFLQEAMSVAKLNHKNIVKLYDYGSVEGLYYLSLEYVEGFSLDAVIRDKKQVSVKEAINIAVQVCEALEHAHQQKIIHRDIKPHNILIDYAGRIKVTDFGIAKAISSATITHAGGMLGSVQYFSPEQAKGERATESSDLYSLGIVLYEMLTGELPFSGESHFSIALKHVQEKPVSPTFYNSEIPENLELIILKILSKKSEYRFSSADELKIALLDYENVAGLDYQQINENLEETKISHTMVEKRGLFKKKKKAKSYIWVALALLIVLLAGGLYLFSVTEVTVPKVIGVDIEEAQEIIESAKLEYRLDGEIFSDDFDKGLVVTQVPESGRRVKQGSIVHLRISGGDQYIVVPDIVGTSIEEAERILAKNMIIIRNIEEIYNSNFSRDEVIYQEPARGSKVPQNSLIDLVVSQGAKPLDFPAPGVIGISQNSAEEIITKLNLLVGDVTFIESSEYSQGTVVSQQPVPNTLIREGQSIDLLVSSGPGPRQYKRAIPINMEEEGVLKIVVQDIRGETVFLQERRESGFFSVEVEYYGEGRIIVFLNDAKINEIQVP